MTNAEQRDSLQFELAQKVSPFIGMSRRELISTLQIDTKAKNINNIIATKLLSSFAGGRPITLKMLEGFKIKLKTVPVTKTGRVKESMSFSPIDFLSIATETWDDSSLKKLFTDYRFLFFVFKEDDNGEVLLSKVKLWQMPDSDLPEVKNVWEKTVSIVKKGVTVTKNGRVSTNDFPKARDNRVAHVRPHARDSADVLPLPNGSMYVKQSFWLNSSYVAAIIGAGEL